GGVGARLAARDAVRRRRIRARVRAGAGGLLVVAGLAWVAFDSSGLGLDLADVTMAGEGTVVDPAQVEAVVAESAGVPLPRLDTAALRERVLDPNGVRRAGVRPVWPPGLAGVVAARRPGVRVPV